MRFDIDYNQAPLLLIWEATRACALACKHCRAEAINQRHPGELSTGEGRALLDDVQRMGTPLVIFTGGDPLQRDDLEDLIVHAKSRDLRVGTIPATTERLTRDRVRSLKAAGLDQMAISIDGCTAAKHDEFRQVPGSFEIAMAGARYAREEGLPLQVNTVFGAWNYADFDALAALVESLGIVFWEVFFLVPTGRGTAVAGCSAAEFDALFKQLYDLSKRAEYIIKITEAPHYRVYAMEREAEAGAVHLNHAVPRAGLQSAHHTAHGGVRHAAVGVNSGKGFCFVDHVGDVYPSGFLPIVAGNVRQQSVIDIYRDSPLFRELRDADLLRGWCGVCIHRELCGGSRARAHAMTGDYLAAEPLCTYGQQLESELLATTSSKEA